MPWYSIMNGTTEVSRVFVLTDADLALQLQPGQTSVLSDHPFTSAPDAVVAPSLSDQQASAWDTAKAYRDSLSNGTCTTASGRVDISDASKLRINGAVIMATLAKSSNQPFSIVWTLTDNTTTTLDADSMIALGVTVGTFVSECQNAGTAIRDKINAATDATSLAAVDIKAGYPTNI